MAPPVYECSNFTVESSKCIQGTVDKVFYNTTFDYCCSLATYYGQGTNAFEYN